MSILRFTCAAVLGASSVLSAQIQHEIVTGRVTSDSTRGVRGADVVVTRLADRVVKTAVTDSGGRYRVYWVDGTGEYAIAVSATGYQSATVRAVRSGADSVIVASLRLGTVTRLAAVVTSATRPVPDRDPATYGAGGSESSNYIQNVARRLAPDQAGDLNAIGATFPGVAAVPGGISVAGLPPSQNGVTLNGLAFAGSDIPRDAVTRVRVITSTYDPSNGWFSGAQTAVDLNVGSQYTQRTMHWTVDAPALQYTDRIAARSGQRYTNVNLGLGGNGQLFDDAWSYNFGVQGGRKAADVSSLLTADPDLLMHAGVAADSASRLVALLSQLGIPTGVAGLPTTALDQNVSFIGRIDRAPYDWTARQYSPTTFGLQAYGKLGKVDAQSVTPVATLGHAGSSSSAIAALTAFYTKVFGGSYLADVRSGVTTTHNSTDPYLALPDGRVLVASALPDSGSGVSTLQFGGNSGMHSRTDLFRWETNAQLQLYPPGNAAHRVKLTGDARLDSYTQDALANQFGTFTYNSLSDVAADRPSSFTRALTFPTRRGAEWNGFLSAGDSWRASPSLQLIYGVRADANAFADAPAFNPAVFSHFGVRTDNAPNSVDLSPRAGFTWQPNAAWTFRGGVGQFRNLVDASLLAAPSVSTGLPGTTLSVSCVGAAVPTPDWSSYTNNIAAIPRACAGGARALVDASPNVQVIDAKYRPSRSWRTNLGTGSSFRKNVFTLEGILSYNLDQPGTFDDNFAGRTNFVLSDEGRSVFVPPSSIVPSTGALSPVAGRADSSFGRVVRVVSDLRSISRQAVFTLRPYIPDRVRSRFGDVIVAYTLSGMRAQQRGFDGAAFGDPTVREWARGDLDARHMIVAQGVVRPFGDARFLTFVYVRAQSGLPFTPLVAGDVNGDGMSNDRAFIADSPELRSLIAAAPSNVADCLSSQIGRAAGRNSCEGPWTATMNLGIRLGSELLHTHRMDLTINLANPLGGLDELLHGNHLRGWGGPAVLDQTLYTVRGFDAANQRFLYDVNQRFGSTSASSTTLRAPFRITLDASIDLARSLPDQMLDRWLRSGRAGRSGPRMSAAELARRFQTTVPDPFFELLQQSDSLLLTGDQVKALQAVDSRYRSIMDARWKSLGDELAALPDDYDFGAATHLVDGITDDLWELTRVEVRQRLAEILSASQTAMLGGWAGQFFRASDRMHVRLAPRGG